MIEGKVDATELLDHLEQTKKNIFAAIRGGMKEGMTGLGDIVASHLHGDPITTRTGGLLGVVVASSQAEPEETDIYIKGTVSGVVKGKPLDLWLEEGTKYPTKGKKLDNYPKQFLIGRIAPATRESVIAHGHGAFRIEPHPLFNPSLEEDRPTILDIINRRIAEACDAE
jgi:hypothetical protein